MRIRSIEAAINSKCGIFEEFATIILQALVFEMFRPGYKQEMQR